MPDIYPAYALLTPGTIIHKPLPMPGFVYEFYETLEILDERGSAWLALARAPRGEGHVYRLTHQADGMIAQRVAVR